MVYTAQPREGTETRRGTIASSPVSHVHGLCSSTPRGDGNEAQVITKTPKYVEVYAAQPREGTETKKISLTETPKSSARFMQLNPARGRKLVILCGVRLMSCIFRFMQLNPARGRKPYHQPLPRPQCRHGLCSSTPRGDGNTSHPADRIHSPSGLCSSTPRGDGNTSRLGCIPSSMSRGLCSSTPRGDGNTPQEGSV